MGLCVCVRDESGNQVSELIADDKRLLKTMIGAPDWKSLPMLASIDSYGDPIFNRIQVEQFLKEWRSRLPIATTFNERALMQEIADLGAKCLAGVHLYLVFIGD